MVRNQAVVQCLRETLPALDFTLKQEMTTANRCDSLTSHRKANTTKLKQASLLPHANTVNCRRKMKAQGTLLDYLEARVCVGGKV